MARAARKTSAVETARKTADEARTMAETVGAAAESVQDVGRDMARRVSRSARSAGEAALEKADEARNALADTGERLSERLRSVAARAEEAAHDIPARVSDAAARVRGTAAGEIVADLRHMAKRNPGIFMAGAALAGFALARLLTPRGGRDD